MKKAKIISLLLTAAIMMTPLGAFSAVPYGYELTNAPEKTYLQTFSDVPESYWAFSYIEEMAERGVLLGYPDGNFYPNKDVSRAEFAKIMTCAAGLILSQPVWSSYYDVDITDWCSPYIETAKYYLSGYDINGLYLYMPENDALREDIAVALVKLKGYDTTGYDLSILKTMFTDWQSISEGARKYVATAVEQGLISGYTDGTFKGQAGITRAEAAALLWRAYQYGNGNKYFEESYQTPDYEIKQKLEEFEYEETKPVKPKKEESYYKEQKTVKPKEEKPIVKPSEKPEPETKKLPYKVDSLCSASVSDTYLMATQDGNDNLYYYDSKTDCIYRMNMNTGKKIKLLDVSSLTYEVYKDEETEVTEKVKKKIPRTVTEEITIEEDEKESDEDYLAEISAIKVIIDDELEEVEISDKDNKAEEKAEKPASKTTTKTVEKIVYDEVEEEVTSIKTVSVLQGRYKNYEVGQLYYNTGNDKLLLVGKFTKYKSEKSYNDKDERKYVIYEIDKNSAEIYIEKEIETYRYSYYSSYILGIIGNMDNGNLFVAKDDYYCDNHYSKTYVIGNENEYLLDKISETLGFIYTSGSNILLYEDGKVYKYNQSTQKTESLWDDSMSGYMYGINNKAYYIWDNEKGEINKIGVNGRPIKLDINTKEGIEVKDFLNMPDYGYYDRKYHRMFISNDESFVFYDNAGGTWRKIEEQ